MPCIGPEKSLDELDRADGTRRVRRRVLAPPPAMKPPRPPVRRRALLPADTRHRLLGQHMARAGHGDVQAAEALVRSSLAAAERSAAPRRKLEGA
jgi:hypothetical protein